ncbi:MAG: M48 family metalloprotease [Bacteroidales bacterium]|nr:M48 family metalloprotease [Bacteroidales bacterium]MBP5795637.1 M48 family metalloprotease [Bacteroidales bacterium]
MKALLVPQPWAGLICMGIKDVDNHSWKIDYRGKILIVAGPDKVPANFTENIPYEFANEIHNNTMFGNIPFKLQEFPVGAAIGYADLVDIVGESDSGWDEGEGWVFVFKNARMFEEPQAVKFDSGVKYFDVPELDPDHLPSSIEFPVNKVETEDDTVKIPLPDDIITKMVEEVEDAEVSYLDFFSTPSVDGAFPRKRGHIQTDAFKKLLAIGYASNVTFEVKRFETYKVKDWNTGKTFRYTSLKTGKQVTLDVHRVCVGKVLLTEAKDIFDTPEEAIAKGPVIRTLEDKLAEPVSKVPDHLPPTIPLEQKMRENIYNALQGSAIDELIRLAESSDSGTYFRSVMEGHSLKVEKPLLDHLYGLFEEVKAALGYTDPIDFYVTGSSSINAFSVSIENDDRPSIVNVNSALLTLMNDQEVKFVLGHELGHLINHDSKMNSLISFVYPQSGAMPIGLQHKVRLWNQLAELEADRYGYLACGDLAACVSAFYKMSSGLDITKMNVKLDVLLEENRRHLEYFLSDKGVSLDSHPVNPIRVEGLRLYATCKSDRALKKGMTELTDILLKVGSSEIDKPMSDFIASAGLIAANIDGKMTDIEVNSILEQLSAQQIFAKEYLKAISKQDVAAVFNESVAKIMSIEPGYREPMLRYIINLIIADNSLSIEEMNFIFEIGANAFGYSKKECALMIAQQIQQSFTPDMMDLY